AESWNCGTPLTPRMAYSASAFAEPVKVNFAWLFRLRRHIRDLGQLAPLLPERTSYRLETIHLFEEYVYRPLQRGILGLSHGVQKLQAGSLTTYLTLLFAVVVVLLIMGGVR
ncbi:MAG TPA: hydrogenase 4 subunit B, partial [Candidatus Ozemobacteraceae bacterium]